MATEQAWKDRDMFLSMFSILDNLLSNYRIQQKQLKEQKVIVFDDPARKADLEALLAEDENNSYAEWAAQYVNYKAIYEAIQPHVSGWPVWADL